MNSCVTCRMTGSRTCARVEPAAQRGRHGAPRTTAAARVRACSRVLCSGCSGKASTSKNLRSARCASRTRGAAQLPWVAPKLPVQHSGALLVQFARRRPAVERRGLGLDLRLLPLARRHQRRGGRARAGAQPPRRSVRHQQRHVLEGERLQRGARRLLGGGRDGALLCRAVRLRSAWPRVSGGWRRAPRSPPRRAGRTTATPAPSGSACRALRPGEGAEPWPRRGTRYGGRALCRGSERPAFSVRGGMRCARRVPHERRCALEAVRRLGGGGAELCRGARGQPARGRARARASASGNGSASPHRGTPGTRELGTGPAATALGAASTVPMFGEESAVPACGTTLLCTRTARQHALASNIQGRPPPRSPGTASAGRRGRRARRRARGGTGPSFAQEPASADAARDGRGRERVRAHKAGPARSVGPRGTWRQRIQLSARASVIASVSTWAARSGWGGTAEAWSRQGPCRVCCVPRCRRRHRRAPSLML
jgi:hypothetical protein